MAKRVLLCLSHSIEEAMQLDLLHSLGYEVASIGGYIDPSHPHDPKRPALPHIPCVEVVKNAVDGLGSEDNLGEAQAKIPQEILDWLGSDGVLIFHHYLTDRLFPQWEHLREWRDSGGRVIWRTVGQSVEYNELVSQGLARGHDAATFDYRADGLEIVRYSPKEEAIPGYAGADALIRFWMNPSEFGGWTGEVDTVLNITQDLRGRDPWTNFKFWDLATQELSVTALGPHSERVRGGRGQVSYEDMKQWLKRCRVYLYTGTQPASYTLGLLEAMMTGIPIVSIGPAWMTEFPYGPELFEGHELSSMWSDDPNVANAMLKLVLIDDEVALAASERVRERALADFSRERAQADWLAYLGAP